ncbi:MAG: hypothetical protein HQL52_04900 [Magnetococcales bacterium]|nr:hypothetical protein [Magnetococcales bacterium]
MKPTTDSKFIDKGSKSPPETQRGSALLMALALVLVGGVLSANMTRMSVVSHESSRSNYSASKALYLAEAGLEAARFELFDSSCAEASWTINSGAISASGTAIGEYIATVTFNGGTNWTLSSTGYVPSQAEARGVRSVAWDVECDSGGADGMTITAGPGGLEVSNNVDLYDEGVYVGEIPNIDGEYRIIDDTATPSNDPPDLPDLPPFIDIPAGGNDESHSNDCSVSLDDSTHYNSINVSNNCTLDFSTKDGEYLIRDFDVGNNVTVIFAPGDYYFEDFDTGNNVTFQISTNDDGSPGHVNFYIGNEAEIENNATPQGGSAEDMTIYVHDGASLEIENNAQVSAVIRAGVNTEVEISNNGGIEGAIFSEGSVELSNNASLDYNPDAADALFSSELATSVNSWKEPGS